MLHVAIDTLDDIARDLRLDQHINWPVISRAAVLSAQVARDARRRCVPGAASWDDLLLGLAGPWQLDEAVLVDERYRTGSD